MRPTIVLTVLMFTTFGVVLGACGGGTVTDGAIGPVAPVDTTKPVTTVQRASLTVRVAIDPSDAAIANSAGLTASGITVRLTRNTAGFAPQTATTGADGSVRFDNLLDGSYQVSADRALSTTELSRLAPADRDASVFAGGGDVVVSPPANAARSIALVANRRGSVVVSESFPFNAPYSLTGTLYGLGTYLEVYNNADTTAYLDGILIARTPLAAHTDYTSVTGFGCAGYPQSVRLDSTLLFGATVYAFPGTGREYPILAGEAKVVAMDAIDHRAAAPDKDQVDLSRADFEEIGSTADTDNPYAANMVAVLATPGAFGRGTPFNSWPTMWVLMSSAARSEATASTYPGITAKSVLGTSYPVLRLPSKYRLDILSVDHAPAASGGPVVSEPSPPTITSARISRSFSVVLAFSMISSGTCMTLPSPTFAAKCPLLVVPRIVPPSLRISEILSGSRMV